jgi:hypothetical protein
LLSRGGRSSSTEVLLVDLAQPLSFHDCSRGPATVGPSLQGFWLDMAQRPSSLWLLSSS